MTQDEHNKAALLAAKFVLTKLGVSTNSPLWNWIEQEVQAWISGGYEQLLRESMLRKAMLSGNAITKFRWEKPHERIKSLRPKPSGKATRKQKARHIKKVAASRSARRKATRRR